MKPCVKCGKMLQDEANFCTGCGSQQTAAGPEVDRWGTPKPAQTVQQAQQVQQQVHQQQTPSDIPTPNMPSMDPVPAVKEKKRGFRARYVVIPLVLALLAAAGVFVWRVLQQPSEIWEYNEDDELFYIEYYDGSEVVRGVEYDDGEELYTEEYRETDEAKKVDTASVEAVDGVKSVRACELFYSEPDQEAESDNAVVLFGNDWRGRIVVTEIYLKTSDGEYVLYRTNTYERDIFGNTTHMESTAPDGTLLMEADFDLEYSFGRLVSKTRNGTTYARVIYDDIMGVRVEPNGTSEGTETQIRMEYHY